MLSPRHIEVLEWVAAGKSTQDIGVILGISHRTAEWHLRRCRELLGANSAAHACTMAMMAGIIEGKHVGLPDLCRTPPRMSRLEADVRALPIGKEKLINSSRYASNIRTVARRCGMRIKVETIQDGILVRRVA